MPDRPRKTPVKSATSPGGRAEANAATPAELLERAECIPQTSDQLIEQMRELASQVMEARARAADRAWRGTIRK